MEKADLCSLLLLECTLSDFGAKHCFPKDIKSFSQGFPFVSQQKQIRLRHDGNSEVCILNKTCFSVKVPGTINVIRILGLVSVSHSTLPSKHMISKVNYSVVQKKAKKLTTKILQSYEKG